MYLITIFTVLLILKLAEVVDWSSWIVASPLILLVLIYIANFSFYLRSLASKGRAVKIKRDRF